MDDLQVIVTICLQLGMLIVAIGMLMVNAIIAVAIIWSAGTSQKTAQAADDSARAAQAGAKATIDAAMISRRGQQWSEMFDFIQTAYLQYELPRRARPEGDPVGMYAREVAIPAWIEYERHRNAWRAKRIAETRTETRTETHVDSAISWQTYFSAELAAAIQRLGLPALSGHLPLSVIISVAGPEIVRDWLLCESWVGAFRSVYEEDQRPEPGDTTGRPYYWLNRAEWLALICALRLFDKEEDRMSESLLTLDGATIEHAKATVMRISNWNRELMPDDVREEVKRLTGIELS